MYVIQGSNNVDTMLKMYRMVSAATEQESRGSKSRNLHNVAVVLDPRMPVITDFKARNLNLTYAKREWMWYLRGDPKDDSITQYATAWAKLKQPDGTFFSNYGQYLFARPKAGDVPFLYAMKTLRDDKHSRRASMMLLNREHLFQENVDTVCTYAINFTIEGNALNMTVMMRSNDVIWGFTNDAFCFWNLYLFAYVILKDMYPELITGTYTHMTNSMHVYERHYDMIKAIVNEGSRAFIPRIVPTPTIDEIKYLIVGDFDHATGSYTDWLKAE